MICILDEAFHSRLDYYREPELCFKVVSVTLLKPVKKDQRRHTTSLFKETTLKHRCAITANNSTTLTAFAPDLTNLINSSTLFHENTDQKSLQKHSAGGELRTCWLLLSTSKACWRVNACLEGLWLGLGSGAVCVCVCNGAEYCAGFIPLTDIFN